MLLFGAVPPHGRKRHCISNEDPKQRQSSAPWCLRGLTGPSQRHPPPRARYKTGGPAASDMDRSMLRQAGTRRTPQRARRSAFTVTWTSTADPVDTAGVGMADTAPCVQSSSGRKGTHGSRSAYRNWMPQSWRRRQQVSPKRWPRHTAVGNSNPTARCRISPDNSISAQRLKNSPVFSTWTLT